MPINNFKDIFVWQKAHALVLEVYKLSKNYPKEELFGLTSQTRRAVVSVASNLVEGFKRTGKQDDLHFCNMSAASLEEVRYQILLARDLGYVNEDEYVKVEKLCEEVAKLTHLWMKGKVNKNINK